MDNLTHSLTGVFLARAGLNRLAPDAVWILLVASNVPDADMLSAIAGPAAVLRWHRDFTHGLSCSPLLALASVLVVRAFSRRNTRWFGAILAAWLGLLVHLLLDLTSNYGVRLLAPFSGRWFEWDLTSFVDPWIWTALLIALFAPLLARIVSSEIGERRRVYPPRGWALTALAFLLVFDLGRAVLHARALATLNARDYNGSPPGRVAAFPTSFNPWEWQALVEQPDRYWLYILDLNADFDPNSGRVFHKDVPGRALPALKRIPDFAALIDFAQYPLWRVHDDENNSRFNLTDLRFGDPVAGSFTCSARLLAASASDAQCDFTFAPNFAPK